MADDYLDSLMEIFVYETNQFIKDIESILIQNETDKEGIRHSIPEIFRIMHTIKSSSAMMGMEDLSVMAHAMEDVFAYLRDHEPAGVDYEALTDIILDCLDCIRNSLAGLPTEDMQEKTDVIHHFLSVLKGEVTEVSKKVIPPVQPTVLTVTEQPVTLATTKETEEDAQASAESTGEEAYKITVFFKRGCQMVHLRAFEVQNKLAAVAVDLATEPEYDAPDAEKKIFSKGFSLSFSSTESKETIMGLIKQSPFLEDIIIDRQFSSAVISEPIEVPEPVPVVKQPEEKPAPKPAPKPQSEEEVAPAPAVSSLFINVAADKLDDLVDLVSEMMIAEMDLSSAYDLKDTEKTRTAIMKLKKLIGEMQEAVLLTRMVPIKDTFQKMRRIVRDINKKQNKLSHLNISGEETEVDRNIIDTLNAPLMHLIRNSVDHGIELPEERERLGKPSIGTVDLSAATEGRNVVITITDDGNGFDKDKILRRAIEKRLTTMADAVGLSDHDIFMFVFHPGFTTNDDITEYSGRGVGMDVVQTAIQKLHGKIYIESELGKGSRITLKLPLTMAVIEAFLVDIGGNICAIPISDISEIIRIKSDTEVTNVNGSDSFVLRNICYRIINLMEYFHIKEKRSYRDGVMLIVKNSTHDFVVFADRVFGKRSIVVKPIPTLFEHIRGISGCTILADGKTSLILSVNEIYDMSGKNTDTERIS